MKRDPAKRRTRWMRACGAMAARAAFNRKAGSSSLSKPIVIYCFLTRSGSKHCGDADAS